MWRRLAGIAIAVAVSGALALACGADDGAHRTASPVTATVTLVTFLLNWSQWFPILVISKTPDSYTLPVALLAMNTELGANFQGIMALAVITTLPVAIVFLLAQKRVMQGMASGAVKG